MDVVLSVTAGGWNKWGERFVQRQPLARRQHLIGAHPSVAEAKAAILKAITAAGSGGRVIINVGHGGAVDAGQANQGFFELAPGGVMRIGGFQVSNTFVDVFYDVNVLGPPHTSDMQHDLQQKPPPPRLDRWKIYQEISQAFKNGRLREVVLLTCRVGNATEFLRKVANDWGVVVRAYRQRVVLTTDTTTVGRQTTTRHFMHLENQQIAGKRADELIDFEEQIPFAPAETLLVGPPL